MQAIKAGWPVDTFQGGFPIVQVTVAPQAPSDNAVMDYTALTADVQEVSAFSAQPDVYRCLRIIGDDGSEDGEVTIIGKNWAGQTVTETLTLDGTNLVRGNVPFMSVDKIILPAQSHANQFVAVGWQRRFGLYRPITDTSQFYLEVDGTPSGTYSVNSDFNTYVPQSNPDGSKIYKAHYLTDIF